MFNRIFAALVGKKGTPERVMIDATHPKAHRTAASLLKKGHFPDVSGVQLSVLMFRRSKQDQLHT